MRLVPIPVLALALLAGCGGRTVSADGERLPRPAIVDLDVLPRRGDAADADESAWRARLAAGQTAAVAGDRARAITELRAAAARSLRFADARHAISLASLAEVLSADGNDAEAERCWRQALSIHAAPGGDALAAATCRDAIARLCAAAGRWGEAEHQLRDALATRRTRLPAGHDDLAVSAAMLADALRAQGTLTEAEPLYRDALVIWERSGRPADQAARLRGNLAAAHHGLGAACTARGDLDAAGVHFEIALKLSAAAAGRTSPLLVPLLADLGDLRVRRGDLAGAESALTRAVDIATAGAESPQLADLLAALAGVQLARHDLPLAQATLRRVIALHSRPGGDPRRLGLALAQSAEASRQSGDLVVAEADWRRALAQLEAVSGSDHPEVAAVLNGLAATLSAAGTHDQADRVSARALAILEKSLGSDHSDLLPVLGNRILVLATAAQWTAAAATAERVVALLARSRTDHPDYVRALSECSALHAQAGAFARALDCSRTALAIVVRLLPADDPNVAIARANCAELIRLSGAQAPAEARVGK